MNAPDDAALLRRFVRQADETAFRTLVERHLPLVHASATRQLGGDTHLAKDVAQNVFALLAARAGRLQGHPTLAGWLFTATRNLALAMRRSRVRRDYYEQRSAAMNESESPRETGQSWTELSPVLDDALSDLRSHERDGVLLRYFENRSYAEIGAQLGVGENVARMRVERSVEKLRRLLLCRGVRSTVATLAGSLAAHGAPLLTADFASQIATHALTTGVSVGAAGGTFAGVIEFMSKAKIASMISIVAVGVAVYEGMEARTQSRRAEESEQRTRVVLDQLAEQRAATAAATQRLQAADEDNANLLTAIAEAKTSLSASAGRSEVTPKLSRADVMRRFEHAKKLVEERDYEGALKEYLWCFELGMQGLAYFGERWDRLPKEIKQVIEMYPAAAVVVQKHRAEWLEQMLADPMDSDALTNFVGLTKALGDFGTLVDVMNRLPANDGRKTSLLAGGAYDLLLQQRNYSAIITAKPYFKMESALESGSAGMKSVGGDEKSTARWRDDLVKSTVTDVEVLLGAGRQKEARQLTAKLLAFDSSATTRAQLLEHAKRAGQPDWPLPNE